MSDLEQAKKAMAYLVGFRMGKEMLPQMLPGLSAGDLDLSILSKGLNDAFTGDLDQEIVNADIQEHQRVFIDMLQKRCDFAGAKNLEQGRRYMEENAKRDAVTTTESGMQFEVLSKGGPDKYDVAIHGEAPVAKVMYKGSLIDGSVFDQSQSPTEFNISQVIPGFTEAIKLMPIGAKWVVTLPANLAYGANGPGSIGPNSTLIFEMELLELNK